MPFPWKSSVTLLVLVLGACSSSAEQENEAARLEDFRVRAAQYFNSGRFPQAYQQAVMGLQIEPDDGGLNLIAGRSLVMQRDLQKVSHALEYLETAQDELENYKADYSLAEFHFRYGSMLYGFAAKERESLIEFPEKDETIQAERLALCEERIQTSEEHFAEALKLLDQVLEVRADDLNALEMRGQVFALLERDDAAFEDFNAAIAVLEESRQYKNRVLATDANLTVEQEQRLRRDLSGDIQREIAIRFVIAGILKRANLLREEEEQYSTILGLDPDMEVAYHSRALCRYELGRMAEASADMREFVGRTELTFDTPQVKEAMRIIEEYSAIQGG
ncbi:MAG: hypothetical protein ACYTEP_08130 [Planctomycetota bacterium]|jgi:tetratricopeptide (TPR) repeat protein